jgi:hypothetical protein
MFQGVLTCWMRDWTAKVSIQSYAKMATNITPRLGARNSDLIVRPPGSALWILRCVALCNVQLRTYYWSRSRLVFVNCSVRISTVTHIIMAENYGSLPQSLQANARIVPRWGEDRLLPNRYQRIIRLSSHDPTKRRNSRLLTTVYNWTLSIVRYSRE